MDSARRSGSIWSVWAWRIFLRELRNGIALNAELRWALVRRGRLLRGGRKSDDRERMKGGWRYGIIVGGGLIGARLMISVLMSSCRIRAWRCRTLERALCLRARNISMNSFKGIHHLKSSCDFDEFLAFTCL